MTKDSCISFPPKDKLIIIRQSLVEICVNATAYKSADPQCAAAILQYFIYRTDGKLDQISEYKTEVEIARKSKQDAPPIPELWIFKTQDELYQDDLLAHFGRNAVVYSLRWLVEVSPYLSERNNPKYSWDKTKQYRVNVEAIQSAIESLPVNTASFTDKLSNTSQVNNGEFEDKPAIPEYTTKKEQSNKESASAALGDSASKNGQSKNGKEPETKEREYVFELVAFLFFGFKDMTTFNNLSAKSKKEMAGRIGKIAAFLRDLYAWDEPVRSLEPSPKVLAIKADCQEFCKWYAMCYSNASRPRDVGKFSEHYLEWYNLKIPEFNKPKADLNCPKCKGAGEWLDKITDPYNHKFVECECVKVLA